MASFRGRRVFWILGLAAAAAVAGRLILPTAVRYGIERAATSSLGRPVEVGNVDLRILAGSVALDDVVVGPSDAGRPAARLGRGEVRISWDELLDGRLRILGVELGAPEIRLRRRPDGSLEPIFLAAAAPAGSDGESASWPVRLDRLRIRKASFALESSDESDAMNDIEVGIDELDVDELGFENGVVTVSGLGIRGSRLRLHPALLRADEPDAQAGPVDVEDGPAEASEATARKEANRDGTEDADRSEAPATPFPAHRLEDLSVEDVRIRLLADGEPIDVTVALRARRVSARGEAPFPVEIEARGSQGRISLEGEVATQPPGFEGVLEWDGVDVPRYLAIWNAPRPWALSSGTTGGRLEVRTTAIGDGRAEVRLAGAARLSGFDASTSAGTAKGKLLEIDVREARIPLDAGAAPSIDLARVALETPEMDVTLSASAESPSEAEGQETSGSSASMPRVRADVVEVTGGRLALRDERARPPFATEWRELDLRLEEAAWPENFVAAFTMTARDQNGGRIEATGSRSAEITRLETNVNDFALRVVDPFATRHSGLRIDAGRAFVDADFEIAGAKTTSSGNLRLRNLSISESDSGWFARTFGVPLDLAIALLRDTSGEIRLPLDATIEEGRTAFDFGDLFFSALRQAIRGGLAAPLKILGGSVRLIGKAIQFGVEPLDAVAGSPALDARSQQRLPEIASMLRSRPNFRLALHGRASAADDAGIARRMAAEPRAGDAASSAAEGSLPLPRELEPGAEQRDLDADPLQSRPPPEPFSAGEPVARVEVDSDDRRALALERARRVRATLVDELGAPRGSVVVEGVSTGSPGVRFELAAVPGADTN